jgi:hypothetical protein
VQVAVDDLQTLDTDAAIAQSRNRHCARANDRDYHRDYSDWLLVPRCELSVPVASCPLSVPLHFPSWKMMPNV